MTTIPLFTVTHDDGGRIVVEIYADDQQAIARRDEITGRAVLASHELRVGR